MTDTIEARVKRGAEAAVKIDDLLDDLNKPSIRDHLVGMINDGTLKYETLRTLQDRIELIIHRSN